MSQAGIVSVIESNPEIPTAFITNSGTAVPIANDLYILGTYVAAGSIPVETTGATNVVTIKVQTAQAIASTNVANIGLAAFNSADFTVDANGFVTLTGSAAVESFEVDAHTAPGTNPVVPNGSGIVTITGGQVAAGTTANVIQTNSLAANTYTIQVQRSQAVASSTIGDNGVAHFNSTYFTVDSNGFVSANGTGLGETITGNTGGALSPTAGNWNILGSSTAAGTTPVHTSGSGSTLTVDVQISQAIASTNATNIGLAAFNSSQFSVDANGFVSLSGGGAILTITGNSGGAESPLAGNFNILGTGSITVAGSANTETVQLTGLTSHAVLVGAGTATITKVGPTATAGQVLQSQGSSSDPAFSTATYPSTTTINQLLYSSSNNVVGGLATVNSASLATSSSGVPTWLGPLINGQVVIGSTGATPVAATLTAGTGISISNGAGSITIASTGSGMVFTDESSNFNAVSGNGYFITGTCTATLPASPSQGDAIVFIVDGAVTVTVTANTGQVIRVGSAVSASAGTAANNARGDSLNLIYRSTGSAWISKATQGTWTIT